MNQVLSFTTFIIKDNGIGMSEHEKNSLLQAFDEPPLNNYYSYEGLGLELVIVKELIYLHNGQIHLESELNNGTVFTVTIPILIKPRTKLPSLTIAPILNLYRYK